MLEANHEPNVLKCNPHYPYYLKERVLGPLGHLSNEAAAKTICELYSNKLNNVFIGHLSRENNLPDLAYKTVMQELEYNNLNLNLNVADWETPSKLICVN